jgi:transposase
MKHYAGLDVSVKETSICIVDETGKICRELKVPSYPEDLLRVLQDPAWNLVRVGLEAGPLSQWLFSGLAETGLPVVCIETRHAKAYLKAQINKTDRNDARGIAPMMRVNLFRPVHVKTLASQKRRALLTAQVASEKSHCHRKRYPRPAAQFRSESRRCRRRQIRTAHPGPCGGHAGHKRTHGGFAGRPAEAA